MSDDPLLERKDQLGEEEREHLEDAVTKMCEYIENFDRKDTQPLVVYLCPITSSTMVISQPPKHVVEINLITPPTKLKLSRKQLTIR